MRSSSSTVTQYLGVRGKPCRLFQVQETATEGKSGGHASSLVDGNEHVPTNFGVTILDEAELCDFNLENNLRNCLSLLLPHLEHHEGDQSTFREKITLGWLLGRRKKRKSRLQIK